MGCPYTTRLGDYEINTADARVAEHFASCTECRDELARQEMLRGLLAGLPLVDAPDAIAQRMQTFPARDEEFTCTQTLNLLEAWREGDLDPAHTFLVDEHLLWCDACRVALAQADRLDVLLHTLPDEPAPAAIAARLADARRPWYTRLALPAWQYGTAAVAAMVLLALTVFHTPSPAPIVATHTTPAPHVQPAPHPVAAIALPLPKVKVTYTQPMLPRPAQQTILHPAVTVAINVPATPKPAAKPQAPAPFNAYRPLPRWISLPERPEPEHVPAVAVAIKPDETAAADYKASAREGMMRMTRDAELASIEESLSNAPEVMVASVARRRPEVVEAAPAPESTADAHLARVNELRKAISEDLRRTSPSVPQPIVVRRETPEKRADGVLFRIH